LLDKVRIPSEMAPLPTALQRGDLMAQGKFLLLLRRAEGLRRGRRQVPQKVQHLIRKMSLANPLWWKSILRVR
jgi:hypothetical protein